MSEHTKLPWVIKESCANYANGSPVIGEIREGNRVVLSLGTMTEWNREKASLIVRCVNSHSELLAAAKDALRILKGDKRPGEETAERILWEAIAKAETAKVGV